MHGYSGQRVEAKGMKFWDRSGNPRQRDLQNESANGESIGYVTACILQRFSDLV